MKHLHAKLLALHQTFGVGSAGGASAAHFPARSRSTCEAPAAATAGGSRCTSWQGCQQHRGQIIVEHEATSLESKSAGRLLAALIV